ncbi:flagellar filament capping protein FliD [Orrella sp. JC864]|uniref:flagellar filament capping protein FliD n=1 Tax=Orrella sp. JC864 TaxID=3120298 RepID=UPI0030087AC4
MASVGSTIGVGSGLPLEQLLADLRRAESAPLALIQEKQTLAEARLSAYGVLKSSVEAVQNAAKALADAKTFSAMKAAVTGDKLTATVGTEAIAGRYAIEVSSLASAQTLVAAGQADAGAALGEGGVITFTLADGTEQTLDLAGKGTSLKDIVAAINADDTLGVQATLINDGSGAPHRLMLTAKETGQDAAVRSISVAGNTQLQDLLAFDADGAGPSNMQETAARNAELTINGIAIVSQSNTVTDAVQGLTLNLTQLTTEPAIVTVSRDDEAATRAITAFVNAYNSLQKNIRDLTSYNSEDNRSSVLTGDSTARTIQSRLRSVLDVALPEGEVRTLTQLGITTNPTTGDLEINTEKLSAAVRDNLANVSELFAGTNGVAARLNAVTETLLRSNDGLLAGATDGVKRTLKDLEKQYESTSSRIEDTMERYRQQFVALDSLVAQMSSTSAYLTQQLAMLGTGSRNNA